jgi:hypothetical protein
VAGLAPDEPVVPDQHYGLYLIDVYTTAWGTTPTQDGKTVWATLRATPVAPR